jgi:spermidine synthase
VRNAAPLFAQFNQSVWQDERVHFIAGDGRNYLLLTGEKYDIISCDPVHPSLGSGSLYTREYFELCRRQMKPHGVISQYLPLHKMTLAELKILLNTFSSVFPHSLVWLAQTHGVLVGSPSDLRLSFAALEAAVNRINDPFFKDPYLVASGLLLNREGIKNFVGDRAAIHSDNHPILEYFSPASVHSGRQQANITELLRRRQPPAQSISGIPDAALLERYIEAQPFYLQGILLHNEGRETAAFRQFQRALEINPLNREIRLFYDYLAPRMR